jgi:hypothetical protein
VTTLATITFLLLCAGLVLNITFAIRGAVAIKFPLPGSLASKLLSAGAMLSVIAVFWFWFRMLADYFRNRPTTNPVAWGFALLVFDLGAALVYFWKIWRPRHAP